jgi:hypothetical protein
MNQPIIKWLLDSDEPWTRYRTLIDLQKKSLDEPTVSDTRAAMVEHPLIEKLIAAAGQWPGYGLKRHNDARHPLHQIATLADFGLTASDPGMQPIIKGILSHLDSTGLPQTYMHLYKQFAGIEGEHWTWMMCDAPTLVYALVAFGKEEDPLVQRAVTFLSSTIRENGWPCAGGEPLKPNFKGPGKREDPCPYANLISLKVFSSLSTPVDHTRIRSGIEVLIGHWDRAFQRKLFLFGTGTDFRKLKYPYAWYDILHVAEVLSRYPEVRSDPRFQSLLEVLVSQANEDGQYTASSMYMSWKGWSFADKKQPSPWLTFLVQRILKRCENSVPV